MKSSNCFLFIWRVFSEVVYRVCRLRWQCRSRLVLCECGVRVRRNAAERARALRRCALYFDAMRFTKSVKVRFWTTYLLNTKETAFSTKPEYHPKSVSPRHGGFNMGKLPRYKITVGRKPKIEYDWYCAVSCSYL